MLRLSTTILADQELLGDPEDERKAVHKFLRVLPSEYRQMALNLFWIFFLKRGKRFAFILIQEEQKQGALSHEKSKKVQPQ